MARLRAADALAEVGDVTGAVTIYDELAADTRAGVLYSELGALLAAEHLIDRASPEEVLQRLAPLVDGNGPWRPMAAELTGIAQIRAGRSDAAREIFAGLLDDFDFGNFVSSAVIAHR